jgi:phage shock protein C
VNAHRERESYRRRARAEGRSRAQRRRYQYSDESEAALDSPLSGRTYRRRPRGRILGVCAWLARYFDVETWVVRVVATTGLIFAPSIVFPAYIIGGIALRVYDRSQQEAWLAQRGSGEPSDDMDFGGAAPGAVLRDAEARVRQMELKLRRMEAHVTTGQFELQREFNRLDR